MVTVVRGGCKLKVAGSKRSIALMDEIGGGGEGVVYGTDNTDYVAKVFQKPKNDTFEKLRYMLANPPKGVHVGVGNPALAWPCDILINQQGVEVGYLMPAVRDAVALQRLFMPALRKQYSKQYSPNITLFQLHCAAIKLCHIFTSLHAKGYVIGDVKQTNVLATIRDSIDVSVSVIDIDSFQVEDPTLNRLYYCEVYTPKYTPPELIDTNLKQVRRSAHSDNFSLAVLLHQMLLGVDPFPNQGRWKGQGKDWPSPEECIKNNYWIYSPSKKVQPSKRTMGLDILHPKLQALFLQAFNDGHRTPARRPSASAWKSALNISQQDLQACQKNTQHIYNSHHQSCPWCVRKKKTGNDCYPKVSLQYQFKPAYLFKAQFDELLKHNKAYEAFRLWERCSLYELAELKQYQNDMLSVKSALERFDTFVADCESNSDESDLLVRWKSDQQFVEFQQFRSIAIAGQPLNDFIANLEGIHSLYIKMESAGFHQQDESISLSHEHALVKLWSEHSNALQKSTRYDFYKLRVEQAHTVLQGNAKFQSAYKHNKFHASTLWEQFSLDKVVECRDMRSSIQQVRVLLDHFDKFIGHCNTKSMDESELLTYWKKNPEFISCQSYRQAKIEKLELSDFVIHLEGIDKIYRQLENVLIGYTEKDLKLSVVKSLMGVWEKNNAILSGCFRYRHYERKIFSAKLILEGYTQLHEAYQQYDERKLVDLWKEKGEQLRSLDVLSA